jgi:hypothetical protein
MSWLYSMDKSNFLRGISQPASTTFRFDAIASIELPKLGNVLHRHSFLTFLAMF